MQINHDIDLIPWGCISFLVVFYLAPQLVVCDKGSFQSRLYEHEQSIAPSPYITPSNNPYMLAGIWKIMMPYCITGVIAIQGLR